MSITRRNLITTTALGLSALAVRRPAFAAAKSGPGYTETEIRIGNTAPYSGVASTYGVLAKTAGAYFNKVNAEGGINGRKIKFISYDDAFSAPKTVEQVRKLVEQDDVLGVFATTGTPTNASVQPYLNSKRIPQLFTSTGSSKFSRPKEYPWTIGWNPTFQTEGQIYGRYIVSKYPDAKIAVLYQNDDYGKEVLQGVLEGLGDKVSLIVDKIPYEVTEPTLDSHVLRAQATGANLFISIAMAKAAAQSIRKVGEIGWKPVHFINNVGTSIGGILKPAGFDHAKGLISSVYLRDPADAVYANDPETLKWHAFLDKYYSDADRTHSSVVGGYAMAQTLVHVLQRAGDDLSRENVMRQATSIKDFRSEMTLPGITQNSSSTEYRLQRKTQLAQFDGERWKPIGGLQEGI